jgi:hypothetical protein
MTAERRMERLERIETGRSLEAGCPRPAGLPEGPAATWPDEALARMAEAVAEAKARDFARPLAWMPAADLLALRARFDMMKARA